MVSSIYYNGDGSTRIFPVSFKILGDDYIRVYVDDVEVVDKTKYDIINNSVVFTTSETPAIGVDNVKIFVATSSSELGDLGAPLFDITSVANNLQEIIDVSESLSTIASVNDNEANINLVAANTANINTVANDIPNVNTVAGWVYSGFPIVETDDAFVVETVEELSSIPAGYKVAIVSDLSRGGTFEWSATGTANGGTVFAGVSGYWHRQYSGAVNVKWFGAVGDGIADDTQAIQSALSFILTANFLILYFPDSHYRVASSLYLQTYSGLIGTSVIMDGVFVPDTTVGTILFVRGLRHGKIKLKCYGKGLGDYVDYSLPDPVGSQQIIQISGCRKCDFNVSAIDYKGRAVRTKSDNTPFKNSFHRITIDTGDISTLGVGVMPIGQTGYFEGTTAFGHIEYANAAWEQYGTVFKNLVDISINAFEGGTTNASAPITFDNCGSVAIDTVNLGDETGSVNLLKFTNGCRNVTIDKFLGVQGYNGILYENSKAGNYALTINNMTTTNSSNSALELNNVYGAMINLTSLNDNNSVQIKGDSRDIDIKVISSGSKKESIVVEGTADNISFSGISRDASQLLADGYSCSKITATGDIFFNDFQTVGTFPLSSFSLLAGNRVTIKGGRYESGTFSGAEAKGCRNAQGIVTENFGLATMLSGQSTITVNHGLISAPDNIIVTNRSAQEVSLRVSSISATTFVIHSSAVVTADSLIFWQATKNVTLTK